MNVIIILFKNRKFELIELVTIVRLKSSKINIVCLMLIFYIKYLFLNQNNA